MRSSPDPKRRKTFISCSFIPHNAETFITSYFYFEKVPKGAHHKRSAWSLSLSFRADVHLLLSFPDCKGYYFDLQRGISDFPHWMCECFSDRPTACTWTSRGFYHKAVRLKVCGVDDRTRRVLLSSDFPSDFAGTKTGLFYFMDTQELITVSEQGSPPCLC